MGADKLIIGFVITFLMNQLKKAQGTIDWVTLQNDVDTHVRTLVPGEWFDSDAVDFVNEILAACRVVLADTSSLSNIMTLLVQGNWMDAIIGMKNMILNDWPSGTSPASLRVMDACRP